MDEEEAELQAFLARAMERLRLARGNPGRVREAIEAYLVEGDALEMSPHELRDYFDISHPGMAAQAGFTPVQQEEATSLFDAVSKARYGAP